MRMKQVVAAVLVSWSGWVSVAVGAHAAAHRTRSSVPPQSTVLYQAAFKTKRLKGWRADDLSQWHVSRSGVLTNNGSGTGNPVLAPFSTKGISDFAVEASIASVPRITAAINGYGLIVRGQVHAAGGIRGGSWFSSAHGAAISAWNGPYVVWGTPSTPYTESVGGTAPTRRSGYNTYRIEVHGTDYALYLNGHLVIRFPISEDGGKVRVGLWSYGEKIQVRSFRVIRLPSAPPLAALPPVKALNLGPIDVPANFQASTARYLTDEELYREVDPSLAAANRSDGRIIGYDTYFSAKHPPSAGLLEVEAYINAFKSAPWAHDWLALTRTSNQQICPTHANCTLGDLTGVGDEAYWVKVDYLDNGTNATEMLVNYHRGAYAGWIYGGYARGTVSQTDMLAQVTSWVKIVDGRIQHSG